MSWDEGFLGARASRPHQAWHSLDHLPHLDQPGTAPWLSFGLADAVPADRVAACSIALKLSVGHRDSMRAGRPRSQAIPSRRCRADHSRKNGRSLIMNMNHEWTPIDQKTDGPASTTSGAQMRLQFGALGVTMSWDDGFLGARASRPHQAWHSLGHLPHLDQPGTAPWLSFGLADGVPAHRVAACSIALKLSGSQRDKYAGGTPALPGDKQQDAGGTPALPGDAVPAVRWGSFEEKRPIVNEDEPRMNTNEHEETRRQMDLLQRQAAPTCFCHLCPWCDDVMG